MFPFLTEQQYAIADSLRRAVGDNLAIAMLREAGSPESQGELLHAFASHGSEQAAEASLLQDQLDRGLSEMHNLTEASHRLQRENDSLHQSSDRPRAVKLKVPRYEGKDSENLLRWLVQVKKGAEALQITSGPVQIDYALSHLGGRAEDWALTQCMANPHCFPSYESFVSQMKEMFLPPNCDFQTRAQFLSSKQGSKTLLAYIQELRVLSASLVEPIPESTKVTVFMRGIKTGPARTQLFRVYPQTLEEAFKIAQSEEYSHSMARSSAPPAYADPNDMDVSALEARDHSAVKCFSCGRMGHMSRECRSKRVPDSRPARQPFDRSNRSGGRGYSFASRARSGNAKTQ
jgi:hypothetical protein